MEGHAADINWDEAFLAYLELVSHGSDASKVRATVEVARYAAHAPEHLLAAVLRVLVPLLETSSLSVRDAAVYALLRIALRGHGSLCPLIGQSGAIPSLVRLLPPTTDLCSQTTLIKCLRALVAHDRSNRSLLARNGGPEAILDAIPLSTASTRRNLLEILATLAMLREVRRAIVSHGGLPYLIEAVSLGRMLYRTRAAHAIGFLGTARRIRHMLVELGVVDVLIGLLRDGDMPAKIAAGNSLGIVSSHLDYLRLVAQAGAIPLYAELLQSAEPLGRDIAEDVFCILAVDDDNMVAICSHLARILGDNDDQVKAAAADVFWDLSSYRCGMQAIRESGAIQHLVEILQDGSGELREKASGALAQMSYEKDARVAMAQSGAIPTFIDMLNCDSDELKENATEALANFSMDPLFHESVSVVLDLPTFRSIRDRLVLSNEYMERSLRQISIDRLTSDLDLS